MNVDLDAAELEALQSACFVLARKLVSLVGDANDVGAWDAIGELAKYQQTVASVKRKIEVALFEVKKSQDSQPQP